MKRTVFNAFGVVIAAVFELTAAGVVDIRNASFEQVGTNGYPKAWSESRNWHGERNGHNGSGGIVYECNTASKAFNREFVQQKVCLQPGKRYRFSGLVKTMDIKPERKSKALGISVYICGFNAEGKKVFGAVARPFVQGTSKDWVKVDGLTVEVPDSVVEAYVGPLADGRCTGVGIVDDIYVEELDMAPVSGLFTDAYRNESAGGEVKFFAALNLDRRVAVKDCTAEFSYQAADGNRKSVPAKVLSHKDAVASIDTTAFATGTNDVGFAVYVTGKKAGEASLPFVRLSETVRRKVTFDRHGRTIVDGKPFFPLGMFSGKIDKAMLDIYAEGPFNCIMPYVRPKKAEFDLCHERNLKVIFFLNSGWGTKDNGKGWVENRIATFKDHPATLAWYMSDEPSLNMAPKLAIRREWAHAADPDHPTWVVLDRPDSVRYFINSFDVYAMDKYPVPNKPIKDVIDSMREGNAATMRAKPAWYVPQSFGWGWLNRPRTYGRGPNRDELANMTWQSIAGGANGIIYYSFGQVMKRPRDGSLDCFEAAWGRAKSAASEVKKYESVLLSVEDAPIVTGATDAVAVRTWRHEGRIYLLAVNCTAERQKVALSLPAPAKLISSEFGPAPEIEGAEIRLDFPPIGYVMMQLSCTLGE